MIRLSQRTLMHSRNRFGVSISELVRRTWGELALDTLHYVPSRIASSKTAVQVVTAKQRPIIAISSVTRLTRSN